MKKKIKNLTKEERERICEKSYCRECPLSTKYYNEYGYLVTRCFKDILEMRVETPKE